MVKSTTVQVEAYERSQVRCLTKGEQDEYVILSLIHRYLCEDSSEEGQLTDWIWKRRRELRVRSWNAERIVGGDDLSSKRRDIG